MGLNCCTLRDPGERGGVHFGQDSVGPTRRVIAGHKALVGLGENVCFAPLYVANTDSKPQKRRLAVSSRDQVRTYALCDDDAGNVRLEFLDQFTLEPSETLTCVSFSDHLCSRFLVGAVTSERPVARQDGDEDRPRSDNGEFVKSVSIRMWDLDNHFKLVKELKGNQAEISCLGVSALRIYSGDEAGLCWVFDKMENYHASTTCRLPAKLHKGAILGLDVDPHFLYTIGTDNLICVWDGRTLDSLITLRADHHNGFVVRSLAGIQRPSSRWGLSQGPGRGTKSPAGLVFVTAISDRAEGLLMEWNLHTHQCNACVKAHDGRVTSLTFGPYDNGPVITGGTDAAIRVWDLSGLQCLKTIDEYMTELRCLCVEPQHRFFSLGADGWLKVWSLVDDDPHFSPFR